MNTVKNLEEISHHIASISKEEWDLLFSYIPKLTIAKEFHALHCRKKTAILDADGTVSTFYKLIYDMGLIVNYNLADLRTQRGNSQQS